MAHNVIMSVVSDLTLKEVASAQVLVAISCEQAENVIELLSQDRYHMSHSLLALKEAFYEFYGHGNITIIYMKELISL
jgi:hypothetical protein